jgi:hypothetical protein
VGVWVGEWAGVQAHSSKGATAERGCACLELGHHGINRGLCIHQRLVQCVHLPNPTRTHTDTSTHRHIHAHASIHTQTHACIHMSIHVRVCAVTERIGGSEQSGRGAPDAEGGGAQRETRERERA